MPSKKNKQYAGDNETVRNNETVPSKEFSVDNAKRVNSTYSKLIELCKKKIENNNSVNNDKIMKLNSQISELQIDLENKKQLNQNTSEQNRNTINNLQTEINNLQNENTKLKKKITDLENTIYNSNSYIDSFNNNNLKANELIQQIEQPNNNLKGGSIRKRKSLSRKNKQSRK